MLPVVGIRLGDCCEVRFSEFGLRSGVGGIRDREMDWRSWSLWENHDVGRAM